MNDYDLQEANRRHMLTVPHKENRQLAAEANSANTSYFLPSTLIGEWTLQKLGLNLLQEWKLR